MVETAQHHGLAEILFRSKRLLPILPLFLICSALQRGSVDAQALSTAFASAYTAMREDPNACGIYTPNLPDGSFVVLLNSGGSSRSLILSSQSPHEGRQTRSLTIGPNSAEEIPAFFYANPEKPDSISFGAALPQASATATPVPEVQVVSTPRRAPTRAASRPVSSPLAGQTSVTPVGTPAAIETPLTIEPTTVNPSTTPTRRPSPTPRERQAVATSTSVPEAPCSLAAVIHGGNPLGDPWITEAASGMDGRSSLYIPDIHRADRGLDTDVIVSNIGRSQAFVNAKYRSQEEDHEVNMIIQPGSPKVIDRLEVPRGVSSLEINGSDGSRLIAAAYHIGPKEMSASTPAIGKSANRFALPIVYKGGGDGVYSSSVRVMQVTSEDYNPRITFYDPATGESIGPIFATRPDGQPLFVREGHGYTFELSEITALSTRRPYSAIVEGVIGGGIAATVKTMNLRDGTLMSYSGIPIDVGASRTLSAPWIVSRKGGLSSGIAVQNLGSDNNSTSVSIFDREGRYVLTETRTISPGGGDMFYLPGLGVHEGFEGWAKITGSREIAAVVQTVGRRS